MSKGPKFLQRLLLLSLLLCSSPLHYAGAVSDALKRNSASPFCRYRFRPVAPLQGGEQCIRWSEYQLNIAMMYSELLLTIESKSARKVFKEIQCLARNNARRIRNNLYVCMQNDYSEVIGNLLAKNIENSVLRGPPDLGRLHLPDIDRLLVREEAAQPSPTAAEAEQVELRTSARDYNEPVKLNRWSTSGRAFFTHRTNSCCPNCPTYYFPYVNSGSRSCQNAGTTELCCPVACQSTRSLEIGAGTSPHICCERVQNEECLWTT